MKNFFAIYILILLASGMASNHVFADGTAPSLGTAGTFGVLASSTITAASASTVNGDLGISPGTAITGPITVSGTKHVADATAATAHTDATTAYNALQSQTCGTTITSDLGGKTLTPGVYCSGSSMGLIGTLTLSGAGVYVFQMGSTLTTATDSKIILTDGATADNVFWQVGSSATLGTATSFAGTIIAQASISSSSNTQTTGRLIALTGAVSLSGAPPTTITVPSASSPQTTVTPTPTQPTPTQPTPTQPTPTQPTPTRTTITPTPPVYEQSTSAITGMIQHNCYTGDYEYIDGSGSHFIKNVGEQYQYLVNGYNNAVNAIKSSNPTASLDDLHTHLAQGQGYKKMITLENCFQTNGINPDSISPMNSNLSQVVAIPEFGALASLVVVISISGIIMMSKRSKFHF